MTEDTWVEILIVKEKGRREIVLSGPSISERIKGGGLDPALFTLTDLNCLFLTKTCIEEIPASISKLANIVNLSLHSNQIKSLPSEIGCLSKLKNLDVSSNLLTELPSELSALRELYSVNLSSNQLSSLPDLSACTKLSVLDVSHNKFSEFPDICKPELCHLSELRMNANGIEVIPSTIGVLSSLKLFDISENKVLTVPGELCDIKLKDINLKANPLTDKRLRKLVDQCKPNQILAYIQQHRPKSTNNSKGKGKGARKSESEENNQGPSQTSDKCEEYKFVLQVHRPSEIILEVKQTAKVLEIRPHIICCIVCGLQLTQTKFSAFLQLQTKLHNTMCNKRTLATIASHDLDRIPKGNLTYDTQPPEKLLIKPIDRATELTGAELYRKLHKEAEDYRKEKKRSVSSGIHKYLNLLEGKKEYPCLVDAADKVISFPPLTNSDHTKMSVETKNMLLEVTSDSSQPICRKIMDTLLLECLKLGLGAKEGERDTLVVEQVRITNSEGSLKTVYPSKLDLEYAESENVRVIRD